SLPPAGTTENYRSACARGYFPWNPLRQRKRREPGNWVLVRRADDNNLFEPRYHPPLLIIIRTGFTFYIRPQKRTKGRSLMKTLVRRANMQDPLFEGLEGASPLG